jgi:hypothetical protein
VRDYRTEDAKLILVRSLRAMLAQFLILMIAAIWILLVSILPSICSTHQEIQAERGSVGFWHALYTLDEGNYGVWEIAKYMADIWSVPPRRNRFGRRR